MAERIAISARELSKVYRLWSHPGARFKAPLLRTAAAAFPSRSGLRARLDPAGSDLLALAQLSGAQPFSLDPPATYLRLAEAAAALIVGTAALVLTASRRLRYATIGLVAIQYVF